MNTKINVEIYEAVSKKTNKPYRALKLSVGEWSTLIFPQSKFEWEHIEKVFEAQK